MTLTFSEEQEQLRASVRTFVSDQLPLRTVRAAAETGTGVDRCTWRRMAAELGLQGLTIPEEHGGSGCGPVEARVVFEELGRGLACSAYFSTVGLAVPALLAAADDAAAKDLLPGIVDGTTIATLAFCTPDGRPDPTAVDVRGTAMADGWRLDGHAAYVTDALDADLLLVVALTAAGPSLFAVDAQSAGIDRTAMDALDITRPLGRVTFSGAGARLVGTEGAAAATVGHAVDAATIALAAEQVGAAQDARVDDRGRHRGDPAQHHRRAGARAALRPRHAGPVAGGSLP